MRISDWSSDVCSSDLAGLLFILALAGLSKHESAGLGNSFGIAGMVVALVATIALAFDREPSGLGIGLMIVAIIVGAAIGLQRAKVVEMTGMPELIALLHSFVGAAAVLATGRPSCRERVCQYV